MANKIIANMKEGRKSYGISLSFYADEMIVHKLGDGFVFKGFSFHDVAPVAGRVSDAEEYGFVFVFSPLQRLIPPGIPVHWIIGVLQKIWAGLGA